MNKTRNGKIARLPQSIREQLNRRLADGEEGVKLVRWLNRLPEVQQVLAECFDGKPVREQNLSEWKAGGYQEWLARQELLDQARTLLEEGSDYAQAADGQLAGRLADVLKARCVQFLTRWTGGEMDPSLLNQLKVLGSLTRFVSTLRRGDYDQDRASVLQGRLDDEREKSESELVDHFRAWLAIPAVRRIYGNDYLTEEQKRIEYDRLLGVDRRGDEKEERAPRQRNEPVRQDSGTSECSQRSIPKKSKAQKEQWMKDPLCKYQMTEWEKHREYCRIFSVDDDEKEWARLHKSTKPSTEASQKAEEAARSAAAGTQSTVVTKDTNVGQNPAESGSIRPIDDDDETKYPPLTPEQIERDF